MCHGSRATPRGCGHICNRYRRRCQQSALSSVSSTFASDPSAAPPHHPPPLGAHSATAVAATKMAYFWLGQWARVQCGLWCCCVWTVNYTIWSFWKMFFINRLSWKHIPDLNHLKGDMPVGALIELRGAKGFDALPSTSERIEIKGCQSY
jgi:hypothetical protein